MDGNRAKQIYNILNGINTTLVNLPTVTNTVRDDSWERFNACLDELKQGYNDDIFLDYKITPKMGSHSFGAFVDRIEYSSKVLQATLYLHNQHMPNNTVPPQETSTSNSQGLVLQQNTSQIQNQEQNQSQEQSQSIEQSIEICIKDIEEHYGEDHATAAKELLGELQKEPTKWSNVQKILNFSANLGKEAFIAVLPVLTQALLTRK